MFTTVKSKFSMIYISLVALIVVLGLVSILALTGINQTIHGLITTNYNSITRLSAMQEALNGMNLCLMEYLYGEESGSWPEGWEDHVTRFRDSYEEERATIILPDELVYIADIGSSFEAYRQMGEALLSEAAGNSGRGSYRTRIVPKQAEVERHIQMLYVSNERALFARRDEAAQSATDSIRITAIFFLIAAVGGYLMATIYTRRFFSPLHLITENIRLIREGNLRWNTTIDSRDEFGMLSEEFGHMVGRLAEFERSTLGTLNSERNRAASLVKSIHQPMLLLDEEGRLTMMNTACEKLFDLEEKESVGLPLGSLISNHELDGYVGWLLAGQSPSGQEKTITITTGREDLFYHLAATPVSGANNTPEGLIIILHDVTEMKRLEKIRGDYIATISHEFKTPLTSIVMGADLIADELVGPLTGDQKEIVDTIREDSQRLEHLVSEILELSRMESSRTLYKFESCSIADIITTSVGQFRALAERNHLNLAVDCPDELPRVRADFTRITWVLNNLLSNAVKYTRPGDDILVRVEEKDHRLEISVEDTGMGVPPEFVDQVFEKYVQIRGYDIEVRGSGLGLAAAREMIEAHGGSIWCDPAVSRGSRFAFTLEVLG